MKSETAEKEIQRKYLQLQLLKQEFNALIEEKNLIDNKVTEIATTINALEQLSAVKKGDEIWSSLGSLSFVKSDITDTDNVLVGVGAGVVLTKKREQAAEMLKERIKELDDADKRIVSEINRFGGQIEKSEKEFQKLAEKNV
ncbi:MAG TPA: prefoldin subunit alpha [archaeon]|nr:prefoldin subunit alpha [archaeon]